jgi:hypothetical protein
MSGSGIVFRGDMKRALALALAVALIGAAFVAFVVNPLVPGNDFAVDQAHLDPSGDFFAYAPSTDYYVMTTMKNSGRLPISVNGLETNTDPAYLGAYAVEFRLAHGVSETANMAALSDSEPFHPVDVEPGDVLAVWVHFRTGPCMLDGTLPYPPGSGTGLDDIAVKWSFFGVPRVSAVPLVMDLLVLNVENDAPDPCGEALVEDR